MQGYSDYLFPAVGFVKGTVGITLAAPVLAGIAYVVYALAR
jgi:hypothetical protein